MVGRVVWLWVPWGGGGGLQGDGCHFSHAAVAFVYLFISTMQMQVEFVYICCMILCVIFHAKRVV